MIYCGVRCGFKELSPVEEEGFMVWRCPLCGGEPWHEAVAQYKLGQIKYAESEKKSLDEILEEA